MSVHYHLWRYGVGSRGRLYKGQQVDDTVYETRDEAGEAAWKLLYTEAGDSILGVAYIPTFCGEDHAGTKSSTDE